MLFRTFVLRDEPNARQLWSFLVVAPSLTPDSYHREGGYVPGACAAKIRARGLDFNAPRRPRLVTLEEAVRAVVERHGGVRAAERATGVDKSFISRLMAGKKVAPSAETLEALGLRAVPLYEVLKTPNARLSGPQQREEDHE